MCGHGRAHEPKRRSPVGCGWAGQQGTCLDYAARAEASTHGSAAACQITFMDVENPDGSAPVSAESAKSEENVALRRGRVVARTPN